MLQKKCVWTGLFLNRWNSIITIQTPFDTDTHPGCRASFCRAVPARIQSVGYTDWSFRCCWSWELPMGSHRKLKAFVNWIAHSPIYSNLSWELSLYFSSHPMVYYQLNCWSKLFYWPRAPTFLLLVLLAAVSGISGIIVNVFVLWNYSTFEGKRHKYV